MNIKKTQEFLYFQNKARHYANLKNVKPAIKTQRNINSYSHSIDPNRMTYFQRYELEKQNEGIINRITDIMTGPKLQIEKQGYSRYNNPFSPKSHLTIEQKKQDESIGEANHILAHKVLNAKPSIGTIESWSKHFSLSKQRRYNISKYNERRDSKGTLSIYGSSTFIPEHYKSFIKQSSTKRTKLQNEQSPEELSNNMKVKVEQLFQLPKLRRLRGSLTHIGQDGQKLQLL